MLRMGERLVMRAMHLLGRRDQLLMMLLGMVLTSMRLLHLVIVMHLLR